MSKCPLPTTHLWEPVWRSQPCEEGSHSVSGSLEPTVVWGHEDARSRACDPSPLPCTFAGTEHWKRSDFLFPGFRWGFFGGMNLFHFLGSTSTATDKGIAQSGVWYHPSAGFFPPSPDTQPPSAADAYLSVYMYILPISCQGSASTVGRWMPGSLLPSRVPGLHFPPRVPCTLGKRNGILLPVGRPA